MSGKIYVFGATGYIGRYLCCHLKSIGADFVAIGRSRQVAQFFKENGLPFYYFDFTSGEKLSDKFRLNADDTVVNLAARLAEIETPVDDFFKINTMGTAHILDWMRTTDCRRFIMTSSHKVYNNVTVPEGTAITEDVVPCYNGDHTPYIISKLAAEAFVNYYNSDFSFNGMCLRLTGVHGYGEILGHLDQHGHYRKSTFELFVEKALKGEKIEVWGRQDIKRDHIYVKDVVSAILSAVAVRNARGIYNIGSGVAYSQLEEARAIADVFSNGHTSDVVSRIDKPGLSRGYLYDISKAKRDIGWTPQFTDLVAMLEDYKREWGLKKFRNYHCINPDEAPVTL